MSNEPQLAAPGAGLPWVELFIGRFLFRRSLKQRSREDFELRFGREREAIRKRLGEVPAERRGERVLIPRVRGLEDSSRFWSAWMTLDHLRICNDAFAGVITALAAGRVPPGKASTADVKPSPTAGAESEEAFERSCDALITAAAAVPDLATKARYEHPWFGPLDAAGWHALGALHLGIHRGQIERIGEALRR